MPANHDRPVEPRSHDLGYDSPMPKLDVQTLTMRTKRAIICAVAALIYSTCGAAPMTAEQVIKVLDETVDWYRTLGIQQQTASEPSDLLVLYDNRQTATQAVRLAFDIARANAELLAAEPSTASNAGGNAPSSQSLTQLQQKQDAQAQAVQTGLQSARQSLATGKQKNRSDLQAKISELQGELDLISARKNLLNTMAEFVNGSGAGGSSATALKAQINAMAAALPSAGISAAPSGAASSAPASPASPATPAPAATVPIPELKAGSSPSVEFGIWDLAADAFRLSEKINTIGAIDRRTVALQATFAQIRTPLINQLKALSAQGDALAAEADAANSAAPSNARGRLDMLANQFKATSTLLIPLSKEGVLLNQFRHNLGSWREAVESQYRESLKKLAVRMGILAVVLAIVFAAAELWKRAVLHYIEDQRRRRQFLLLRRIALWALVVLIIGFSFASELGSIATFAGLITAGVAVAMQSVLVSIVGYFFLIGKYGIRVGDRVQIGEVTGEVIDIGFVRMYLMELGGHGLMGPTGRVVAYANSIVFQVSTGLFKQVPGFSLAWHEITLNLPAGSDYGAAKEKLLAAVTDALQDYREEIVRQTKEIQKTTASRSGGDPQPTVQLNFSSAGVKAIVRYPVHLQHASEIDERVSRELLNAIPGTVA